MRLGQNSRDVPNPGCNLCGGSVLKKLTVALEHGAAAGGSGHDRVALILTENIDRSSRECEGFVAAAEVEHESPAAEGFGWHTDPKTDLGQQSCCPLVCPSKKQLGDAAREEHHPAPLSAFRFEKGREGR
jgi:hypothetical protein